MHPRLLCGAAAILLMLGVAAGAFGSHALRNIVNINMLAVWHTAVLYQLIHGLGLLALAAVTPLLQPRCTRLAGPALLLGTLLFSFSLYALVLTNTTWIGIITPIGGVLLIAGWGLVTIAALSRPKTR
ncbi:DUF423 domain-containing protein [Paenalcaligenes niemegkensis]|uniref:DUF423 domain-containing protein n=1 Tax=Paenalcaligenes niemegkensis TaxID=2895469 RepID=UPI001EE98547|nr:DUF423 domain-containing protein [Paenalcaligenes niemegkensis]MCQ9615688.1 DUF423 domain-containing protein [Paenalcaligenes niemegkensis]